MKKQDFCRGWVLTRPGGQQEKITLPHDAMLGERRDPGNPSGAAGSYFPGGRYRYEKRFAAPKEETVLLQFEGVYKNAEVFLNGVRVGGMAYGYLPFFVDIGSQLRRGEENMLTVVADNSDQPNSRWYTGSGIYRPVWLWTGGAGSIPPEGIRVTTLSYAPARIRVEAEHNGAGTEISILDAEGSCVASALGKSAELEIPDAKLWSEEAPNLYTCRVTATGAEGETDSAETAFGIRKLEWSGKGLFVNGRSVKLRGGCIHHDNGILGACSYPEAEARRVRILKACGFNALRSAHNPMAPAMLEACDRLGMYVLDESWDVWQGHKSPYDYALDFDANWRGDLAAMVARDYNHPSVIAYSIGNEVSDPAKPRGAALERRLVHTVHRLDPTRPVTAGLNLMLLWTASMGMGVYKEEQGGMSDGVSKHMEQKKPKATGSLFFNMTASVIGMGMSQACRLSGVGKVIEPACEPLDIVGYNYGSGRYVHDCKEHPERLYLGTETFRPEIAQNWAKVEKLPNLIGDFQWAAWDYLGEAGCGAWTYENDGNSFNKPYPYLLASSGSVDILGHPTAEADLASAVWGVLQKPAIHVRPVCFAGRPTFKSTWRGTDALPSWSWRGCEGKKAKVEVYFRAESIELRLNGKKVGKAKVRDCKARFTLPYAPGTLEAIAYDEHGRELGRNALRSAEGSLSLRLRAEKEEIRSGQLCYVEIDLVGQNGEIEANADREISVRVEGGDLLGFGSALPKTENSYLSGRFPCYYGRSLAVLRAGGSGELTLCAAADGVKTSTLTYPILNK